MMIPDDIPPCLIYIDKEGRWFHEGAEMIHREFIRLFYQHIEIDPQGRYIISWRGERCYVEVEDTPFVVWRVIRKDGASRFILYLSDDSQEDLKPDTLYVGEKNVLYCKVKDGAFIARFNRPSYYQLAEHIVEEDGRYFLPHDGEKYLIHYL